MQTSTSGGSSETAQNALSVSPRGLLPASCAVTMATPDGKHACVSNTDTDDVSIIDVKARREVTRVKVGKVPKRLAIAISPIAAGGTR